MTTLVFVLAIALVVGTIVAIEGDKSRRRGPIDAGDC